jgi:hypothetical protein
MRWLFDQADKVQQPEPLPELTRMTETFPRRLGRTLGPTGPGPPECDADPCGFGAVLRVAPVRDRRADHRHRCGRRDGADRGTDAAPGKTFEGWRANSPTCERNWPGFGWRTTQRLPGPREAALKRLETLEANLDQVSAALAPAIEAVSKDPGVIVDRAVEAGIDRAGTWVPTSVAATYGG